MATTTTARVSGEQRRAQVLATVLAADPALSAPAVQAAVARVAGGPIALARLATALAADPAALRIGAPPMVGALVAVLRAEGDTCPRRAARPAPARACR